MNSFVIGVYLLRSFVSFCYIALVWEMSYSDFYQFSSNRNKTVHSQSFSNIFLTPILFFIFFLPVLLKYNWHTTLCKFRVNSITIWFKYIMKDYSK